MQQEYVFSSFIFAVVDSVGTELATECVINELLYAYCDVLLM